MPWPCRHNRGWRPSVTRKLNEILTRLEQIMTEQQDIDQAVATETALLSDLTTQTAAIAAAQQEFQTEIANLTGKGVDTTKLAAINAQIAAAQAPLDAAVTALTAAAQPPAPANPPASA